MDRWFVGSSRRSTPGLAKSAAAERGAHAPPAAQRAHLALDERLRETEIMQQRRRSTGGALGVDGQQQGVRLREGTRLIPCVGRADSPSSPSNAAASSSRRAALDVRLGDERGGFVPLLLLRETHLLRDVVHGG